MIIENETCSANRGTNQDVNRGSSTVSLDDQTYSTNRRSNLQCQESLKQTEVIDRQIHDSNTGPNLQYQ